MTKDELIEQLAKIVRPGECPRCGKLGPAPQSACLDHAPYQPGTDPSTARHLSFVFDSFVANARQILGLPNSEIEI